MISSQPGLVQYPHDWLIMVQFHGNVNIDARLSSSQCFTSLSQVVMWLKWHGWMAAVVRPSSTKIWMSPGLLLFFRRKGQSFMACWKSGESVVHSESTHSQKPCCNHTAGWLFCARFCMLTVGSFPQRQTSVQTLYLTKILLIRL